MWKLAIGSVHQEFIFYLQFISPIAVSSQDTCYRLTTADNKRAAIDTEGNLVTVDPFNTTEAETCGEYCTYIKLY